MIYQKFLEQTLKEASKIANEMFGKVFGRTKDHDASQVLTEADLMIGKFIIGEIEKTFPDHNIIDEESGVIDKKSGHTWAIDPIDGTANFAVGIPLYGVMVGLLQNDKPVAGGVALPFFDNVYCAEKGYGALVNGKSINVGEGKKFNSIVFFYSLIKPKNDRSFSKYFDFSFLDQLMSVFPLIGSTTSVYDSMMVAEGRSTGMMHLVSKIWDNVAQHIIIEEAGGIYTDFYGKAMDYSKALTEPNLNYTYCAAAPSVHKKLQEIIHKVK